MTSKKTSFGEQGGHVLELLDTGKNLFLLFDGVKIAKRGKPGTRHAKKWVPLLPGWEINDVQEGGQDGIEVKRDGETLIPIGPGSSEIH